MITLPGNMTHHDVPAKVSQQIQSPGVVLHSPCKLDILVDGTGNYHGDDGIVPGAEEHKSETQAHPQEGQSPIERATETCDINCLQIEKFSCSPSLLLVN